MTRPTPSLLSSGETVSNVWLAELDSALEEKWNFLTSSKPFDNYSSLL